MRYFLLALSALSIAKPASSQDFKMYGVRVAPCSEGDCASLGIDVRVLPWNVTQYRQMVHSKDAAEPFLPFNAQEKSSLVRLLKALGNQKSSKTVFESMLVEGGNGFDRRPSSFAEFHDWFASRSCTAKTYSLTLPRDTAERYGLLRLNCVVSGKKVEAFTSVTFRAGQPIRLYTSPPIPVYGPGKQANSESAK